MNAPRSTIEVLLVEDDPADAETVRRFLVSKGLEAYSVTHAESMARAVEVLTCRSFDIVILDLQLGDSSRDETFGSIRRHLSGIPVIILSGLDTEDEAAALVRHGAQDYLVKGAFDGRLLRRVVRFGVERAKLSAERDAARLAESKERELRQLAESAQRAQSEPLGSKPFTQPFRAASPELFAAVVDRYGNVLEKALERRIFKDDSLIVASELKILATELCTKRVGPRDLVEVHSTALEERTRTTGSTRAQAIIEEGRLVLLELMGYVIAGYRRPQGTT